MDNDKAQKGECVMAGLLYKDFAAIKGRVYVVGAVAVLILSLALRLILPKELGDYLLVPGGISIILLAFMGILYQIEVSLLETDEGKKQKHYFLSLPVTGKQYVASKYLFILLAFYFVLSFGLLMGFIFDINCETEEMQKLLIGFMGALPVLACTLLIVPTIELPFLLSSAPKEENR